MARREPITDIGLRKLALRRFQEAPQWRMEDIQTPEQADKLIRELTPPEPMALLDGALRELIPSDTPTSKRAAIIGAVKDLMKDAPTHAISAVAAEFRLYRSSKVISEQEGPDSVAESLQVRVDVLKEALQALVELPAIPHASRPNPRWYHTAYDLLRTVVDAEEGEIARQNKQISPSEKSTRPPRQRASTQLRNDLALGLKGIALGLIGKTERDAETWVTYVFDELKPVCPDLHYPNPDSRPKDFERMFSAR